MNETEYTSLDDEITAGYDRMKQAHGAMAMWVFIIAGVYHHIAFGGFGSLFTIKSTLFFVVGMFVAPLTIGVMTYLRQRSVGKLPLDPHKPRSMFILQLLGLALFVLLVVSNWMATRWAYLWLYARET